MHVDMDAFFAACELTRRPELRGKPVIVGGGDRGVVLAATYEARAFGVHSALPMRQAMALCPRAVVVPPDHRLYSEVSHSVMGMMKEITPIVEPLSIDEAFLDVSGARRRLGPPTVIGAQLRARVQQTHGVTCSVGIAQNKFLAKLASTHAKPDGLLLVPKDASVPFVRTLPVGALWGVGEKTATTLHRWGITTVAELADTDLTILQGAIGRVAGAHLHNLAWARDPRPVVVSTSEKSISNETTFHEDVFDIRVLEGRLLALCDQVAGRLRSHGWVSRTIAIKVRTSDFHTVSRSRTLPEPTDVAQVVFRAVRELFGAVDTRGLPVRLVGVRAEGLVKREGHAEQITLDEAINPSGEREAEIALDSVRQKFGRKSIALGTSRLQAARY
jgi:DNA polymerase-4